MFAHNDENVFKKKFDESVPLVGVSRTTLRPNLLHNQPPLIEPIMAPNNDAPEKRPTSTLDNAKRDVSGITVPAMTPTIRHAQTRASGANTH